MFNPQEIFEEHAIATASVEAQFRAERAIVKTEMPEECDRRPFSATIWEVIAFKAQRETKKSQPLSEIVGLGD